MEDVVDLYELSPLQQGMLFHTIATPGEGVYVEQVHCTLEGELDVAAFRDTWARLVARHEILRSAFFWEELEKPLQVVYREVEVPFELLELGELDATELEQWRARDRRRGLTLEQAPLLRLALLRLGPRRHHLVWTFHHLLLDGWSVALLFEELFAIYAARLGGVEPRLPAPPRFRDYITWLQGHDSAAAERFWRRALAGFDAPTALELPAPARRAEGYAQAHLALEQASSSALAAWAAHERLTLASAVLGAWALLLGRYSRRDDVLFATTRAERPAELVDSEHLVGLCLSTLPVRVGIDSTAEPASWLRALQEQQLEAAQHGAASLVDIQRWSEVPAGTALFESLVVFENYPLSDVAAAYRGVLAVTELALAEHTNYPLTLIAVPGPRLQLTLSYDQARFDAETIERMLRHLAAALEALPRPGLTLARVPLTSADEAAQLWRWSNGAALAGPPPAPAALPRAFAAQVARTPEAIAVRFDDDELTYAELAARANRLAQRLGQAGVRPGTLVGLCVERSLSTVVAILGILGAGGAYVPLDPDSPAGRLAFVLEDAALEHLVLHAELRARFPALPAHCVELELDGRVAGDLPATAPEVALGPEHTAYVIYTSGSTGKPKGVFVTHGNVARLFTVTERWFSFGPEDRWTLFHSYAFDFSVWELWGALLYGGCVVVVPYWVSRNPEAFHELLRRERITVLNQTPSAFYQLVHTDERAPAALALRAVVFGGEALDLARLRSWIARHGDEHPRLINMYGITETTVHVTYRRIRRADAEANRGSLIGEALPDLALAVLSPGGQLAPIGVAGELFVGGAGVGAGYLRRPELTAQRFLEGGGSAEAEVLPAGTRWYRSGDLVRYLGDGELEYLGRIDQQVKLRGFRIELGEIESALAAHPLVRDGAVLLREDQPGHKRLVGYVVPRVGEGALDPEAVLSALHQRLPDYMVPTALVVLEAMPLTGNGKLDRRALPAPELRASGSGGGGLREGAEQTLAELWSQVLGVAVTGREDSFFSLGGDSILAMQVVSRARAVGLAVTPRLLFQHQTVAALAAALEAGAAAAVTAAPQLADGEVPLTPIQRWFVERRLPEPDHFNQSLLLELRAAVEPERLRESLARLVDNHPALRLRWHGQGDGVVQRQEPASPVALEVLALEGADDERWRDELAAVVARSQAGLHLASGPVLRAALVSDARRARLLLVAHHVVIDAVSWRVLLEDLALALAGAAPLPATTSFARWSQLLHAAAEHPAIVGQLAYWEAQVRDVPRWAGAERRASEGESRSATQHLDAEETRALLQDAHAAYRTKVGELLLTALALATRAVAGPAPLVLELESHGRWPHAVPDAGEVELDRTLGWFTSLYPARLELPDDGGLGAALLAIKEQLRAAPEGGLGYGLLRYLHPDPALRARLAPASPVPLLFNYLGQLDTSLTHGVFRGLAPESSGDDAAASTPRSHPISVAAYVRDKRLVVDWRFAPALEEQVGALAAAFSQALRELVAHCRQPGVGGLSPSDLPLAGLDRVGVEALAAAVERSAGQPAAQVLEDAYPLAPLQAGLLYQSLLQPETPAYVEQVRWQVDGALEPERLAAAWHTVSARHAVLRTAFVSAGLRQPLQAVLREVSTPWRVLDWRALGPAQQDEAFSALLESDRAAGFALDRAPLVRWTIVRLADEKWRCLWTHHHLLLDGWSVANLLAELLRGYTEEAASPAPVMRYRDYVAWAQALDLEAAAAFWRGRLGELEQPTPLPAARAATAVLPGAGEQSYSLRREDTAELERWARAQRLTLNSLVQGAWALLLARYSGQRSVAFGATVSGRPSTLPGAEQLVGLCINTLPVVVRCEPDAAPAAWLAELQEQQSAAEPFSATPLTALHGWSRVPRGQPLFESIVVFENYPVSAAARAGAESLAIGDVRIEERSDLPLTLIAVPGEALELKLGYRTACYDDATAAQLLRHLARLLTQLPRAAHLGELTLLEPSERHDLLRRWNATEADFPREATLRELLLAQCARTPSAIAVSDDQTRLSYGELFARAETLAGHLQAHGVGPETFVAVHLHRSVELMVALVGISLAGGAYVPLDPDHPQERRAYVVEDARPRLVLTQRGLSVPPVSCPVLALEALGPSAARPLVAPALRALHAAYLIYTSGSTGRPKGVINTHRGIVNRLWWMQRYYQLGADDVVLQKTPTTFDVSVWELFWPLLVGARLHLARPGGHLDRRYLVDAILAEGVTTLHFVPSMLQVFVDEPRLSQCGSLRRVICSGEALPLALQQRFAAVCRAPLYNLYGPTEAAVDVSYWRCSDEPGQSSVPIGHPISNTQLHVLDEAMQPVPVGVAGELYLGGVNLARGYHGRPGLTAERFVPDPHALEPGARLYRTGDLARRRPDGAIEYLGRTDFQLKIRGVRIELGEIEHALSAHPAVAEAVVVARDVASGQARLVAYWTQRHGAAPPSAQELREHLRQRLPEVMVPSQLVELAAMPLGASGKVDRRALPAPEPAAPTAAHRPSSELERLVAKIWGEVLGLGEVDTRASFFDLGGHSLLLLQAHRLLEQALERSFPLLTMFEHPTVASLARHLGGGSDEAPAPRPAVRSSALAIIGMAGRFPGAAELDTFWANLRAGLEGIVELDDAALEAAGVPEAMRRDPGYVRRAPLVAGIDQFDAAFWGVTPREAALLDPQQRVFLECAWEALEHAGYAASEAPGRVGVFAGAGINTYLLHNLLPDRELVASAGEYQLMLASDPSYLATRVAFKLGLTGPAINVQTACSTSLVAVHLAAQSLLAGECELALAGGVSLRVPQEQGYLYTPGMIHSPDGRCRPFDAAAQGTVGSSGAGVVLLRRLDEALAAGDTIYAVLRGSAINNDGARKVGYTAPSVQGQAEVVAAALQRAGVEAASVSYVEAHGTATSLGDPIEVAALARVFEGSAGCALGAVKSNLGHLDAAAGIAGLIKTVLALVHRELPPTLHYAAANPRLELERTPFFVQDRLTPWQPASGVRRAGVSSFGIGGTNAHVVLEEAPALAATAPGQPWQLLPLSARSAQALAASAARLAEHLLAHPAQELADVASTLQLGRTAFAERAVVVCRDRERAVAALREVAAGAGLRGRAERETPRVAFLFPGQGAQYPGMGRELYDVAPEFRQQLDACAALAAPLLGRDLRELLLAQPDDRVAADALRDTALAQPALFAVEVALARQWRAWGIEPAALLGHSVGELAAAAVADVLALPEALALVCERGRLMGQMSPGSMMSVGAAAARVLPLLPAGVELAAINAPELCVLAGEAAALEALAATLRAEGVACRALQVSHAFHSAAMEPMLPRFTERVAAAALRAPALPLISNVSGSWLTDREATTPAYWARQVRSTVQFERGLATVAAAGPTLWLEVGPGRSLATFARAALGAGPILGSLPHPDQAGDGFARCLGSLGQLWLHGVTPRWSALHPAPRRRVALPSYPFERQRHWVEARGHSDAEPYAPATAQRQPLERWASQLCWRSTPATSAAAAPARWLVAAHQEPAGRELVRELGERGHEATLLTAQELAAPAGWPCGAAGERVQLVYLPDEHAEQAWEAGAGALLQAVPAALRAHPQRTFAVSAVACRSLGLAPGERQSAAHAAVRAALTVLGQELPEVSVRWLDVEREHPAWVESAAEELTRGEGPVVALRGYQRFAPRWEPAPLPPAATAPWRDGGVYLLTGGAGALGRALAWRLARACRARVAVLGRGATVEATRDLAREVEAVGGQLLPLPADVTSASEVAAALETLHRRWGQLDGVLHGAGVAGAAALCPCAELTAERWQHLTAAKEHGTRVLAQALARYRPAWVLGMSSLSTVLGGLGMASYAAANLAQEALFAEQARASRTRWISVAWDGWGAAAEPTEDAIGADEGFAVIERVLAQRALGHVAISVTDLQARRRTWIERPARTPSARAARPGLSTAYVAPRDATEEAVAAIWSELLGIAQVGVDDDFFELGGHSLLATQVAARLRTTFQLELPLRTLFERPTIAGVAEHLASAELARRLRGEQADAADDEREEIEL